jgi:hypothetical protein
VTGQYDEGKSTLPGVIAQPLIRVHALRALIAFGMVLSCGLAALVRTVWLLVLLPFGARPGAAAVRSRPTLLLSACTLSPGRASRIAATPAS